MTGPFAGVTASQDGQTVRLEFDEPARDVLDKLSFGLYAIAHPSDWNDSDGKWKDQKSVIASGPYEIASWGEGQLVLKQRTDFPLAEVYGNKRAFGQATFVFGAGIPQADFVDAATGLRDEPFSAQHAFRGEANNGILFVRLMGQISPDSPVHNLAVRRALRKAFYESLASGGLGVSRSFLPPALGGQLGTEIEDPLSGTLVATPSEESLAMPAGPVRICDYKAQTGVRKQLSVALVDAFERLGVASQVVTVPPPDMARGFDAGQTTVACDVAIILTGVLLSDPWDDLRFMVRSAEGIRLPDPTGRLEHIVAKPTIDIQSYNAAIWDDALVWPVLHTTSGFWIRPQKVSLDAVNLSHPPSELALIQRL
jgi:hypothetical protein